jgi:hypothetical protein
MDRRDLGIGCTGPPARGANLRDISGAVVISEVERFAVTPGPMIDELVRVAQEAGLPKANRRTIRGMVDQRFVASSHRVARSWRYQNVAVGQVDVVSRCRAHRVDPDLTRLAVFVETGTGDIEQIRALACQLLRGWQAELATDLERLHADPSALHDEAARAARMRRNPPLPRRVRVRMRLASSRSCTRSRGCSGRRCQNGRRLRVSSSSCELWGSRAAAVARSADSPT